MTAYEMTLMITRHRNRGSRRAISCNGPTRHRGVVGHSSDETLCAVLSRHPTRASCCIGTASIVLRRRRSPPSGRYNCADPRNGQAIVCRHPQIFELIHPAKAEVRQCRGPFVVSGEDPCKDCVRAALAPIHLTSRTAGSAAMWSETARWLRPSRPPEGSRAFRELGG